MSYERLAGGAPGLVGVKVAARGQITLGLVAMIEAINKQIDAAESHFETVFQANPDQKIFASLPRLGHPKTYRRFS